MTDSLDSVDYVLDTGPFAGAVRVVDLRLTEAVDEPFRCELDVVVQEADVDVTELLGTDAVLRLRRPPLERRLSGLVHEVHEGVGTEQGGFPRARLVVAPALGLLRLRRNTRMFQGKSVPEILEDVLGEGLAPYGREASLELNEDYVAREYCLQYQESDLDFLNRLMEEEGIHSLFDHGDEKELLLVRDDSTVAEKIETFPGAGDLELQAGDAMVRDREPIIRLFRYHRPTVTSVVVRDHDWTRAPLFVEAEQRGEDDHGIDRELYEHAADRKIGIAEYDAGARRYESEDADRQVGLRLEAEVAQSLIVRGVSRVTGMTPGAAFALTGHPEPGFDGDYFITRVVHESRPHQVAGEAEAADSDRYHNRFECIPLEVPHRPARRTPRPVIEGVQTAVVTGPSGEEVHVDEHGRITLQFHWDRENPADETSSCWVRVKQEWAGAGWGFWWVPRMGMEVVVHFIDGDPDRPLVTGAVYDGQNPLPYPLPDEKTKSTIKSNRSLGGDGDNELRFEDKAGGEQIYIHAQRDYDEVVEHDHTTLVQRHQSNEVDGDQRQTVHGSQTERVDGTQSMSVGGNRTVQIEGDYDETVDVTETRHVAGDVTESFAATETRTLAADVTEDIGGSESRVIGAAQSETIAGSRSRTVGGDVTDTIAGPLTESVLGGIASATPAAHTVTAAAGWTVLAPGGIVINAPAGAYFTQPGGMTRVDYEWNVTAQGESTQSALNIEYYITKTEAVGAQYAAGVQRIAIGKGEEETATASYQRVAEAKSTGVSLKKNGLWNRFWQKLML